MSFAWGIQGLQGTQQCLRGACAGQPCLMVTLLLQCTGSIWCELSLTEPLEAGHMQNSVLDRETIRYFIVYKTPIIDSLQITLAEYGLNSGTEVSHSGKRHSATNDL